MNYLVHHGIKGQKWGIRRYQNPDGSLTEQGRERYRIIANRYIPQAVFEYRKQESMDREKRLKGVETHPNYDILKKKTKIYRVADKDKLDNRPKYVSPSTEDRDTYMRSASRGMLYLNDKSKARVYTYKAKRDLKIAKGKEVAEYILQKYGDQKMVDDYAIDYSVSDLPKMGPKRAATIIEDEDRDIAQYVSERLKAIDMIATMPAYYDKFVDLYHDKNINDDVITEFAKRGYDAIQDIQDKPFSYYEGSTMDYPMIILNPKDSIK